MCILCGELIMHVHWTDQLAHEDEFNPTVVVGENQRELRRSRLKRVRYANEILSYYGLSLSDWNGSKYLLSDKKGKTEVIHDLGTMWPAADKLINGKVDPLDPRFLESMPWNKESMQHAHS